MKLLLSLALLTLATLPAFAQGGNRVLSISGTNTTSDWALQKVVTYSLTGPSTNTHVNVPTSSIIKTLYVMRVSSDGTRVLDFAFPVGITTNWTSGAILRTPRNGQTTYFFEQYGSTVDITPDPAVFATADNQILGRAGGVLQFAAPSSFGIGGVASTLYSGTLTTVSNTTTETAIYTNATAISANILGTNKVMVARFFGNILNNTGGTSNYTVRAYVGTTRVIDGGFSLGTALTRVQVNLEFWVTAINSASVQETWFRLVTGAPNDLLATSGIWKGPVSGSSVENSTATLPFSVTITPQHAVGTMVWDQQYAFLQFP